MWAFMDDPLPQRFIKVEVWKKATYFTSTRKAVEYVSIHFGERIELQKIATVACMEKTAFSKSFKRKTGITFREFLQNYRISQAVLQIEASDESITNVALSVGFGSLATFERVFRRIVGCTPSAYRTLFLRNQLESDSSDRLRKAN